MNRKEIAPGVFVTTLPGDKFKRCKIAIQLIIKSERATATALALLPNVLGRRCEAIPDPQMLARQLFDLYGADLSTDSYTMGENRILTVGVSGLKSAYALEGEDLAAEYLALACNLLFAPKLGSNGFEKEDVSIEKGKQADYLKSEMNEKRSYCLRQARRKLFGDSPLGIESSGYLSDLDEITPASLYQVYKDLLCQAQIEVVVCGADGEKVAEELQNRLAEMNRAPQNRQPVYPYQGNKEPAYYAEPMDTAQGKLCLLFSSGHILDPKGEAVMRVANALLGALPTSRLFTNVREKQSLCYYCSSTYISFSGILSIDSGINHLDAKRASAAILAEVKELQETPVTPEELQNAHLALQNVFDTAKDSPDALANWAFVQQLRGSELTLDQMASLIRQVTAEEVQQALARFTLEVEYVITGKEDAE